MPHGTCSIADCTSPARTRQMCVKHYERWRRHGDPHYTATPTVGMTTEQRFWFYVRKAEPDACWEWQGTVSKSIGYGVLAGDRVSGKNEWLLAHRFSYELHTGPLVAGLHIDHLCRNTVCVNPTHLEQVTVQENTLRGIGPSAVNATKTHCIHGHELTPENVMSPPSSNGARVCRECSRQRWREWNAKRKAGA